MDTYNTIKQHRSIRRYKPDSIPGETLNRILKAGVRASTTGNMQLYSIIVTKDELIKEKLWELHFKQNMVREAPVILTFCADINRFGKWCKYRNAEPGYDNFLWFYNASIDALLASQNVSLQAEAEGLGICYLGTTTYNADKIIELLGLPKGVIPVTTIVAGYPDETPALTDRLPLQAVVHEDKYKDYSEEDINNLYSEKESLPSTKALLEQNNLSNLAKIFTERRYTHKDNLHFSKSLLSTLTEQGFMNNY